MMNQAFHDRMLTIQREHQTALRLLTAINEGDDSVMPEIHTFLKSVKERIAGEAHVRSAKAVKAEKRKSIGRKNSGKFEVTPRVENGCDYGATGLVLARKGNTRLIWRSGTKFWADMLTGYTYTPGNLVIHAEDGLRRVADLKLTNNHRNPGDPDTRLSKKLIEKFAERIDAVFGAGTAELVKKLDKTIVIEGTENE